MPTIDLPGNLGFAISYGTQEEADQMRAVLNARHAFAKRYCQEQEWPTNLSKLSIKQVLQIRAQEGWKNPVT